MKTTEYFIEEMADAKGNPRPIPKKYQGLQFFLKHVRIGKSAVLVSSSTNSTMITSLVADIHIWDNRITITTMNTQYILKSITDESGNE